MPAQEMELTFPLKGINETWAFGRQPDGSTPGAQNVVPFDPLNSRARGGQRWGSSKYYPTRHNGVTALQSITATVDTVAPETGDILDAFTQGDGVLSDTDWYPCEVAGANINLSVVEPYVSGNKIVHSQATAPGTVTSYAFHKSAEILRSDFEMTMDVTLVTGGADGGSIWVGFVFRSVTPSFPNFRSFNFQSIFLQWAQRFDGKYFYDIYWNGVWSDTYEETIGSGDFRDHTWWAETRELKLVMEGNVAKLYAADSLIDSATLPGSTNAGLTIGFTVTRNGVDSGTVTIDNWTLLDQTSQSSRRYKIVTVSGGDVFSGYPRVALIAATNGTNALNTSGRIDAQFAYGKVYFTDGDPAHYKLWTYSTDTVTTLTPTAGTLPMGSEETAVNITAVDTDNKRFTVAEDWSARTAGDYFLVAGSTGNDGYYTLVSLTGAGPTVLTVSETIADATVDGTIQYQDQACKINCLYRGRLVMAGLKTDPQNWFMSAVNEPLDWDYGATPISATMAVAGNQTNAGKCPDIITCLAPYSDDLMFIGGDHTLWRMTGDPADRGRIDNISYKTGISGPDAYAFDPNGTFYFYGTGTIWRMAGQGAP